MNHYQSTYAQLLAFWRRYCTHSSLSLSHLGNHVWLFASSLHPTTYPSFWSFSSGYLSSGIACSPAGGLNILQEKEKQRLLLQKLEEAKENMPSSQCSVCMLGWTTRIRACLHPCGHASVCFPCAEYWWRSKGRCPICNSHLSAKPVMLPHQLFIWEWSTVLMDRSL